VGVIIYMHSNDHPPPHFHVRHADGSAIIEIETMRILEGRPTPRIYRLVAEWGAHHRALLRENWRRVMAHEPLLWIEPPER
jgi:hypothetical protein